MKNLIQTIIKLVIAIVVIGVVLVAINFTFLSIWMFKYSAPGHGKADMQLIAEALVKEDATYRIKEKGEEVLRERYEWAMLIDAEGEIIWEINLPKDIPLKYTLMDVASFSRWYLNDYPVSVWEHEDGIMVLGNQKHSYWKYNLEYDMNMMNNLPLYGGYALILSGIVALLFAIAIGYKLYRSLEPLISGIEKLEDKELTQLETNGMFGEVAKKINKTSKLLGKQEELLGKRDHARLNWIRGISHDVRTPLAVIMGYAAQIEDDVLNNQATREQAATIKRQSIKIKELVNDLNLVSQLEYDMQPLRIETISFAEVIRNVVVMFLNDDLEERLDVELDISDEAQRCQVRGDKVLLNRALTNIIGNSIKHNPNKIQVKVKARCTTTHYEVYIMDNGIGIEPENLEQIKKWNTSLENTMSNERLHGLGLLIVGKIIEGHQGTWDIRSEQGYGVTYIMKIPI
ncbi:MAG: sensor histidine kinase [Cellulosilyticaceae bacterium]